MDGALHRCVDDEQFLLSCIERELDDPQFDELKQALEQKDVSAGFEAAHGLKGVLANVGLTPLYDADVPIVETLRAGSADNLMPSFEAMMQEKEKIRRIVNGE